MSRPASTASAERVAARQQVKSWRARYDTLTKREQEVFERVIAGKMNKQIASDLGAAERTIKANRAHLMKKLNATSVADLVHIATLLQHAKPLPQIAALQTRCPHH